MTEYILAEVVLAVLVVLMLGVGQFALGRHNPSRASGFMRMCVIMQTAALALILGAALPGLLE